MATATQTIPIRSLTNAMREIGLNDKLEELLDQVEFQRRLKISLEEADKDEDMPAEDAFNEIAKRLKTGYYR